MIINFQMMMLIRNTYKILMIKDFLKKFQNKIYTHFKKKKIQKMNSRIKKRSKKKKLNQTNLRENKISLLLILNIIIS